MLLLSFYLGKKKDWIKGKCYFKYIFDCLKIDYILD